VRVESASCTGSPVAPAARRISPTRATLGCTRPRLPCGMSRAGSGWLLTWSWSRSPSRPAVISRRPLLRTCCAGPSTPSATSSPSPRRWATACWRTSPPPCRPASTSCSSTPATTSPRRSAPATRSRRRTTSMSARSCRSW